MPPGNTTIVMKTVAVDGNAQSYRLGKITEIQTQLERERDKRAGLNEKYRRGARVVDVLDGISAVVAMISTASAIAVLSTIVAAPIAVVLQGVGVGAGVFGVIGRVISRKFALKVEKHEKIKTLAEAKLNTISYYVSKSLEDDNISDEEYSLILNELERFNEMKKEIRSEMNVSKEDEAENREAIAESFKSAFEKSKVT
jgi:predicted DNA-binding protein